MIGLQLRRRGRNASALSTRWPGPDEAHLDNDTEGFGFTLQPMGSQIAVTADALTDFIGASKVAIAYDNTEEYTRASRAKSAASSRAVVSR